MSTESLVSSTLPAFTREEAKKAKIILATAVAHMMGRKLEEDDWNIVYCAAKGIPMTGWSNLNIDVNHDGLGVEQKLLRCGAVGANSLRSVCGTTRMHPSATRSIRISNTSAPAEDVMRDVLFQYEELIRLRTRLVKQKSPDKDADMRTGWLLWEDSLTEFIYFEERLIIPNLDSLHATWNTTPARGARKESKSLWIYNVETNKKVYSVTTNAGVKIQPYFDVPPPTDPNLYYFRVQNEFLPNDTVRIWVSASTARSLGRLLGRLDKITVSEAILAAANSIKTDILPSDDESELARPIELTSEAFDVFTSQLEGVSNEHRAQLLVEALHAQLY